MMENTTVHFLLDSSLSVDGLWQIGFCDAGGSMGHTTAVRAATLPYMFLMSVRLARPRSDFISVTPSSVKTLIFLDFFYYLFFFARRRRKKYALGGSKSRKHFGNAYQNVVLK